MAVTVVVVMVGLSGCGGDSEEALSSLGPEESAERRESGPVEMIDDQGRWTLRVTLEGDQICVELQAGLSRGNNCSDGDGPLGYLGLQNGTFAPEDIYEDSEVELPEEWIAATRVYAYAYGRVPEGVERVRVTTSLGDVFEVDTLRPATRGPGYFVITIPAAQAPTHLSIDVVEFAERDPAGTDGYVWIESFLYFATLVPPAPPGCVEELASAYNSLDLNEIRASDGIAEDEQAVLTAQIDERVDSNPVFAPGGRCEQVNDALSPDDQSALAAHLHPEIVEVLAALSAKTFEDLKASRNE